MTFILFSTVHHLLGILRQCGKPKKCTTFVPECCTVTSPRAWKPNYEWFESFEIIPGVWLENENCALIASNVFWIRVPIAEHVNHGGTKMAGRVPRPVGRDTPAIWIFLPFIRNKLRRISSLLEKTMRVSTAFWCGQFMWNYISRTGNVVRAREWLVINNSFGQSNFLDNLSAETGQKTFHFVNYRCEVASLKRSNLIVVLQPDLPG